MDGLPVPPLAGESRTPWLSKLVGWLPAAALLFFLLILLVGVASGPVGYSPQSLASMHWTQQVAGIGMALRGYAADHGAHVWESEYPDGGSSTEIFQKLLDGGYATDPNVFYVPMWGKRAPVAGQKLKPENVCFDMTGGVAPDDSGDLPLVFMTGYRITYAPGGGATALIKPYPAYWWGTGLWSDLRGMQFPDAKVFPGLAVCYKSQRWTWIAVGPERLDDGAIDPYVNAPYDGTIHGFVPATFDSKGKTYRQLTPEGVGR